MFAKSMIAAAFVATTAVAQTASGIPTISTSAIAAEVSASTKASWCVGQQTVCLQLCGSTPLTNTCAPDTLTYTCTCSNGTSPGLQYYQNSIDSYTCNQAYSDCVAASPNNLLAQNACKTGLLNRCGMLNAAALTSAAGSSSSAAATAAATTGTATSGGATAGSATSARASATTSSLANAAMELSFGVVGAGLFAAFGFML